jgi:hypothetical protein
MKVVLLDMESEAAQVPGKNAERDWGKNQRVQVATRLRVP